MENSNSQFILITLYTVWHFGHRFKFNAKDKLGTTKLIFCAIISFLPHIYKTLLFLPAVLEPIFFFINHILSN